MNESLVRVRKAGRGDLRALARCHAKAFPGSFLTLLGQRVVTDFYRSFSERPGGICLVASPMDGSLKGADEIAGFVAGGDPQLRPWFIRHRIPRHLVSIGGRALRSADLRAHLAARIPTVAAAISKDPPPAGPGGGGEWATLLSIGVDPRFRGFGLGSSLIEAFKAECVRSGYRSMRLSVRKGNQPAMRLYERSGWKILQRAPSSIYYWQALRTER